MLNDGFQYLEQRDADNNITHEGVISKKSAFATSDNRGLYDVLAENLRWLYDNYSDSNVQKILQEIRDTYNTIKNDPNWGNMAAATIATNAANEAKQSAENASSSATEAKQSASAANTSATNAETSSNNAKTYLEASSTSATNAANSEKQAQTYAENASSSSELSQKWAEGSDSPDGLADDKSDTGFTKSSKEWAIQSKNDSQKWAEGTDSPDKRTDTDSSTGLSQSAKSWALQGKADSQKWAMSDDSPSDESDNDSLTGKTQSSKSWSKQAKTWAVSTDSPDGQADSVSSTKLTQSSKSWAIQAKNDGMAWAMSDTTPDNSDDTDSTTGKTQSSKTWAIESKTQATNSKNYANNAKTSEDNAKSYCDSALESKKATLESEANAKSYAESAKTSEDNAKASENNVSEMKTNLTSLKESVDATHKTVVSLLTDAETQASHAAESANEAQKWAEGTPDSESTEVHKSAKTWASEAESYANNAKNIANSLSDYATQAKEYAEKAAVNQSTAKTSEEHSKTYAENAKASADESSTYATNAKTSETNSKESEENSADSATLSKKWAMSDSSPDDSFDADSSNGKTQSSKTWANIAKTNALTTSTNASEVATNTATVKNLLATIQTIQASIEQAQQTVAELEEKAKQYADNAQTIRNSLSNVVSYKGTVDTFSLLPSSPSVGDMYNITKADTENNINAGDNVVWSGTAWDNMGGIMDTSNLAHVGSDVSFGTVTATSFKGKATSATVSDSTNSVDWSNVQNKPSSYVAGSGHADTATTADSAKVCTGNSATASEVAWTGITGKPSTYTPATHNHDTSYPSTSGSRATGTWGISVTGTSANVTQRKSATAVTSADYPNNQAYVPDMSFMAYWNGAYNSSNSSNLKYCANGTIIGSNTISSQSVKYATSAGTATTATTANAVAWDNVTGKPSTYTPASHTHSYLPLSGGTITGKVNIQSATLENMPQIKRTDGANFAGIRCENTDGYLGAIGIRGAKNSPIVRVDTSGNSYPVLDSSNYNSYSPTKTGTGATGTWGISISGNAATATTANAVEWGNVTGKPSTYTPATHTHSYLPLSGGTLSNPSNTNGNVEIHRDVSSGSLGISGGSEIGKGAALYLRGEDSGGFTLRAGKTNSSIKLLTAEPSGTLTWGGDDLNGAAIKFKSVSTSLGIIWYKSGLIFQWGQKTLTAGTTSYTVNLPLTATKNHNIQITTTTNIVPRIADITNSSFNVTFNSSPTSSDVMHWLVIGYLNY